MRRAGALLLLVASSLADPGSSEDEMLARWSTAGPEERRRMGIALQKWEQARRFSAARPIVVAVGDRTYTLAQLFQELLEPALSTPLVPANAQDLGLTQRHRDALAALKDLRDAYQPPHPVHTGTLNLMLEYAYRALTAPELGPRGQLRFFSEAIRNVRELVGRVEPDLRTAWQIRYRLLPALLGVARRGRRDPAFGNAIADAASLLFLPSILDERAQRMLATLTRGRESRRILLRAYRDELLDELGLVALARSVIAQVRGDAAFAAGSPPLALELLCDPAVPARERGELVDAVIGQLAPLKLFGPTVVDLCAAAYGGAPKPREEYVRRRAENQGPIHRPKGDRAYRFLQVILVQEAEGKPPAIHRVVRVDRPLYEPLYERRATGGRRFAGALVPSRDGEHADFLGPAPRLTEERDTRLLRRPLRLERVSIRTFGRLGEVIEICVALPEDQSEPVPTTNPRIGHVIDLLEARLTRSPEEAERARILRLLVRIDTPVARELAVKRARTSREVETLLPLAERGHLPAARALLASVALLDLPARERALAAAVRVRLHDEVRPLCSSEDVSVAALAGDALLGGGHADGIRLLLKHRNRYARAAGTALAMRLTPLAKRMRVTPRDASVEEIAQLCKQAFTQEDPDAWRRYGAWLEFALTKPDRVKPTRREQAVIKVGKHRLSPEQGPAYFIGVLDKDQYKANWAGIPPFILSPVSPGRGMSEAGLARILDRIEEKLDHAPLRQSYKDALIVLACAQHGIEMDAPFLKVVHERLTNLAGGQAPPGAERKAGVYWPIWAAGE